MSSKVYGSSLLIAGCCIGAGMLGMPVISGPYGFMPAVVMFAIGFCYMLVSGFVLCDLIIDEAKKGSRHVHLLSLSDAILGKPGKIVTWALFSFLFYAVLSAYTIAAAKLMQEMVQSIFPSVFLSTRIYAVFIAASTCYLLTKKVQVIDVINRWCVFGLVVVYIALIITASTQFDSVRLLRSHWTLSAFTTLPLIVFSFGYHNLIPTVASYLEYDRTQIRKSIILGTGVPLLTYIIWEAVIFGVVPLGTSQEWVKFIESGEMITAVIANSMHNSAFVDMSRLFAFFAIVTSYAAVGMSMTDFLYDGFTSKKEKERAVVSPTIELKSYCTIMSLMPPLLVSISNPSLFLSALSYSGGVIAMLLFGIMPALLLMIKPISNHLQQEKAATNRHFFNAQVMKILFLIFGALFIMSIEIGQRIGL